jgi:uncharacterized protein (TIGR02145 family)
LTYTITGAPASGGTASFALSIGGQACTLTRTVSSPYAAGSVFCTTVPTAIVDVLNPTTGKTWMDRNLGATQVAATVTDANAYGDLYQWGRGSDGHQCRASTVTSTISSSAQPGHNNFILNNSSVTYNDWLIPQNINLWQGLNGVNNPCPSGYRLPTDTELDTENNSWTSQNSTGAFSSPLKLTLAGYRYYNNGGAVDGEGVTGNYWSSTVLTSDVNSRYLFFGSTSTTVSGLLRASGASVRCIKN